MTGATALKRGARYDGGDRAEGAARVMTGATALKARREL